MTGKLTGLPVSGNPVYFWILSGYRHDGETYRQPVSGKAANKCQKAGTTGFSTRQAGKFACYRHKNRQKLGRFPKKLSIGYVSTFFFPQVFSYNIFGCENLAPLSISGALAPMGSLPSINPALKVVDKINSIILYY